MTAAVLYEQGAVSPSQIIGGTSEFDRTVIVLGDSEHARKMRELFIQAGCEVHDLADRGLLESLRGISGITTFSEPALGPAAGIAVALGRPGHDAATVRRLTDKQAQRAALRAAGVDATASVPVSDPAAGAEALRTVGLPAVIKPVHGVNSRNTVLVETAADAAAQLARVLAAEGCVLVEEYLPGAPVPDPFGDYVSVETVVQHGDRCHLAVTGKLRLAPPFRESGQFWPARLDAAAERAVLDLTDRAVVALGVTTGVLHTELKLTPDGPRLIEVNGRIGGYVTDLAARAGGIDLVEVAVRVACGQSVELAPIRPERVFFQFTTPAPVEAGTLGAAGGLRELRAVPGVTGVRALVRPGTPVGGVGTLDLNLITGDVPGHAALAAVTGTILDTVSYDVDFGAGPVRRTARDLVHGTGRDRVAARTTDERFRTAVETLRVPVMGTEAIAPLLTALVRLVRPRRVLEVGMGYTTPFLAATLAELAAEVPAEAAALGAKTRDWLERGRPLADDWMSAEPALLAPDYYTAPYRPRLVAVDDLSIPESSSARVAEVLRELGLDEVTTVVNADLRSCAERLPADFMPIDFAWVDAWECLWFFDHFWEHIDPDGGLVAMHYLLTYPEGEAFLRYLSEVRRRNPDEFEVVSLLEPHKLTQNSVTIIRRTSGTTPRRLALPGGRIDFGDTLQEYAQAQARHS